MKRNMTAKTRRKPKGPMSKREAENALWGMFEEFLIDGDLFSFTDHAGIDVRHAPPDHVWDRFRGQYERGDAGVDFDKFLTDFCTWGPIASRTIELQLEQARNAAGA
jgi:hypothetical protein